MAVTARFRLSGILREMNISQSELARLSGLSFVTVNAMANNRTHGASLDTLDRIARALGIEPGSLIEAVPHSPPNC